MTMSELDDPMSFLVLFFVCLCFWLERPECPDALMLAAAQRNTPHHITLTACLSLFGLRWTFIVLGRGAGNRVPCCLHQPVLACCSPVWGPCCPVALQGHRNLGLLLVGCTGLEKVTLPPTFRTSLLGTPVTLVTII